MVLKLNVFEHIDHIHLNFKKFMFSFLQKKIAVPSHATAYACSWDHYEGFLAIGASEGFLKLIKL